MWPDSGIYTKRSILEAQNGARKTQAPSESRPGGTVRAVPLGLSPAWEHLRQQWVPNATASQVAFQTRVELLPCQWLSCSLEQVCAKLDLIALSKWV